MITNGQERAIGELQRLNAVDPNALGIVDQPHLAENGWLVATISVHIGAIETRDGGLDLREQEEFILWIPPDFPFDRPQLKVSHKRFAGFPHVTWATSICLYQSSIEWNPSDGLYGFFDRLRLWLGRAAINEMDPVDGPLEPPHHDTDINQNPFVVRANAPCKPGESWSGLAILAKQSNYTELVAWNDLSGDWPTEGHLAFAVILPNAMPMEFPSNGAEFLREIEKAGMGREQVVRNLGLAALLTPEGDPIHLVLGLPMRRAKDGSQRLHIAVWTMEPDRAEALRIVFPKETDTEEIRNIRKELRDILLSIFELSSIKWCRVLEDRPEIIVRRDNQTPAAWFEGKKILILGCGALGSWIAEIVARAKASQIHLVDNAIVKPGLLSRQNFELQDVGASKAFALARRLKAIAYGCTIESHVSEAHRYITEEFGRIQSYDLIIDCTASSVFQIKLERDWKKCSEYMPPFISLVIDAQARHCLCVVTPKGSHGGIWELYLWLKRKLCIDASFPELTTSFYSDRAVEKLFQPEPGCSDPTFIGSTADVVSLASTALNLAISNLREGNTGVGIALSAPRAESDARNVVFLRSPQVNDMQAGIYRIRISESVFAQAKGWVKQNARLRSPNHETGGLLWGLWDDAVQTIWVWDISGPPPDSQHSPDRFICGVKGTHEQHQHRIARTYGACGFVGYWHTHPDIASYQSSIDMQNMTTLVSSIGQNQKRSLMLIFGRTSRSPTAGIYVYESQSLLPDGDLISIGSTQMALKDTVA